MSGRVGDLSEQQEDALKEFKITASDLPDQPEKTDQYYLRWLRARNFNVGKALDMYTKHLQWRKDNNVDDIDQWTPPAVLQKYFPGGFFGEDKEGYPVYYEFIGNIDFKGLARSVTPEDVIKRKIVQGEYFNKFLKELSEKKGHIVDDIVVICNLENLSYQRHCHWPSIRTVQAIFKMYGDNYPERSKSIFVINAPKIFPIAYNLVKTILEEETKKKIVILGSNWKEELQQYISPDQLPQAYGGTRCEPDPKCTKYINWGGDVPEEYFLSNLMETKKEEMEKTVIKRGSTFQLEIDIEVTGTAINWEFLTTDFDVGFGVFHKPLEMRNKKVRAGDMTAVVSTQRVSAHEIPQSGVHRCNHTGTYVLRFDNTYSWTRSKELFYTIRVLPPDTELVCEQEEEEEREQAEFADCIDQDPPLTDEITPAVGSMSLEQPPA